MSQIVHQTFYLDHRKLEQELLPKSSSLARAGSAVPAIALLSGGVVVLHRASGLAGSEVRQTVAVRVASFGEQAKKLVIRGDLLQHHDAASRPLRRIGLSNRPRVRGYHRLPDPQV